MPGDTVMAVDGEDMTGIVGELVIQRILGPAGTDVVLTIQREGIEESFDVEVTRAQITIPNVEYRMLEDGIGYIQLFRFADESHAELRAAIEDLLDQNAVGLIVDLRNNGGGYLHSAVAVSSEFLPTGEVVVIERYGDGNEDIYKSEGDGLATDIPFVLLVNEGSASASEIVAGAIQDHERAPLVGMTTFGKGLVQYQIPLSDEKGAVSVTIAHWFTPDERLIQDTGLEPDYPLAAIPQAAIDDGYDIDSLELDENQIVILSEEDIQNAIDPQLDKAVEVLIELLSK
jgi:carboxyl-terminal processing protease